MFSAKSAPLHSMALEKQQALKTFRIRIKEKQAELGQTKMAFRKMEEKQSLLIEKKMEQRRKNAAMKAFTKSLQTRPSYTTRFS